MQDQLANTETYDDSAAIEAMQREFGDPPAEAKAPETPVEEAKAPEVKPEEKKPERSVEELERNYNNLKGALSEERARAREEKAQREQLASQLANMQELMKRMTPAQQQAQEERHPLEPLVEYVKGLGDKVQTFERETQAQREERELMTFAMQGEQQFRQQAPDYEAAINHLGASRMAELEVLLPDTPAVEDMARSRGFNSVAELRNSMMIQERQQLAQQAKQMGRNPAELLYTIAQRRGYAKAAPAPAAPVANPIESVRKGQEAAASLSGGGRGGDAGDVMSINDLSELYIRDPAAADAMFNKMKSAGVFG